MMGPSLGRAREILTQPSPGSRLLANLFPASAAMLAAGVALMGSGQSPARPPAPFEVGRPFPLLALPDCADGRPRSIADFRGRKIILHVFASW
jgi:hypothetical protein